MSLVSFTFETCKDVFPTIVILSFKQEKMVSLVWKAFKLCILLEYTYRRTEVIYYRFIFKIL